MSSTEDEWQKFYLGEVPPLSFFFERITEIKRLAGSPPSDDGINILRELCLIGLAAYFEAYCKAQFAAIINIHPPILRKFVEQNKECTLGLRDIIGIIPDINYRIGSLLSEQFDFGSAKEINSRFCSLLKITPLSKKESKRYEEFLTQRNLLVHHGGIFTMKYQRKKLEEDQQFDMAHRGSLVIKQEYIESWSEFLWGVAQKVGYKSQDALQNELDKEGVELHDDRFVAFALMNLS